MKKAILVLIWLLCFGISFAQVQTKGRVLTWSVGKVKIDRGPTIKVTYPLLVSINNPGQQPQLGTSTIRFFYDAGYLEELELKRIVNSYEVSGLRQSKDVFGEAFGFPGGGGVFTQFNLLVNESNPLNLSAEPTHIMDITFSVKPGARTPSCIPLVLDNHPGGWGLGANLDSGYLPNEGGISSSYYLDGMLEELFLGDDEVHNYLWEQRTDLSKSKLEAKGDIVGGQLSSKVLAASGCLEATRAIKEVSVMDIRATGQGADQVSLDAITDFELSCFPNPTSGIVNVSYRILDPAVSNAGFELVVFDAAGQFVLRKKEVPSISLLDLSGFKAGVYQVVIQNSGQEIQGVQRIVLIGE